MLQIISNQLCNMSSSLYLSGLHSPPDFGSTLGRGGTGDWHQGCAADKKSAALRGAVMSIGAKILLHLEGSM